MKLMAASSNVSNAPKNPQYLSCKWHAISLNYIKKQNVKTKSNINHEDQAFKHTQ